MSNDLLSTLQNLDPTLLTEVVRKQQHSPSFELLDWTVEQLIHAQFLSSTGGLFKFAGTGEDSAGVKPWTLVLKILRNPGPEHEGNIRDVFYWKREFLAFQSGMLANLPSAVPVPQVYGAMEHEEGA